MKPLDIYFTVSPAGCNNTAKLCYTCKTSFELEGVKSSISDYLDRKIVQLKEAEKQEDTNEK